MFTFDLSTLAKSYEISGFLMIPLRVGSQQGGAP